MNNNFINQLENTKGLSNEHLKALIQRLKNTKINILLVGGTGVGKSSTINALFDIDTAIVGTSGKPETMEIQSYELNNVVLWDSPGLGDSTGKDPEHKKLISDKLQEKDSNGNAIIDMVLLILDGSSRDYSSAYTLLREVITPNLGNNAEERLVVALNKADMAIPNGWDFSQNRPTEKLEEEIGKRVEATRERIKEETGFLIETLYFSAGWKEHNLQPYNVNSLLNHIMKSLPTKKRIVLLNDVNRDPNNFQYNDNREDYQDEINKKAEKSFWENVTDTLKSFGNAALDNIEKNKEVIISAVVSAIAMAFKAFKGKQ